MSKKPFEVLPDGHKTHDMGKVSKSWHEFVRGEEEDGLTLYNIENYPKIDFVDRDGNVISKHIDDIKNEK